jgi:hypothetical protein
MVGREDAEVVTAGRMEVSSRHHRDAGEGSQLDSGLCAGRTQKPFSPLREGADVGAQEDSPGSGLASGPHGLGRHLSGAPDQGAAE